MSHNHTHHHDHAITEQGIFRLFIAFIINMILSLVEFVAGVLSGSVALIGDALHNTFDALSILIAIIASKIALKGKNDKFSYGFKRSESIGGFINLILLFVAGGYLLYEGIERIISPTALDGTLIVIVSVIALVVDLATAKISHAHSHNNMNMKMLFIHNLSDALGSIGVLISGALAMMYDIYFVDGVVAILIALYMIFQAVASFPNVAKLLMNAVPNNINIEDIKASILALHGVEDIHHIHVWNIDESEIALDCHIVSVEQNVLANIQNLLADKFDIQHTNIQIEKEKNRFCVC